MTAALAAEVVSQVASALRFLHSREVSHGAVTADNIFVRLPAAGGDGGGARPHVKLGGVEHMRSNKFLFERGKRRELPSPGQYSPPEAFAAGPLLRYHCCPKLRLFQRRDMWQLGLVLHRLLFDGAAPFEVDGATGRPRFVYADQEGGFFRWDEERRAASRIGREVPWLAALLPGFLTHAEGRRESGTVWPPWAGSRPWLR